MSMQVRVGLWFCVVGVVVLLGGCGGQSGPEGVEPPVQPEQSRHRFEIDFAHDTVTVVPADEAVPKLVDADPGGSGAEVELTLTVVKSQAGNPGRRHVNATVTNHSSGTIGVNRQGTVTGVDLCFTLLRFRKADGTRVAGGGVGGEWAWNAETEMPIFHLPEAVAPGATSSPVQIDFALPKDATVAVVEIVVRAGTQRYNPVQPARLWVSTVAGSDVGPGLEDGPAAIARFAAVAGLYFREDEGDLLIADWGNCSVRRLANGVVTTLIPSVFADVGSPVDVATDAEGNIVICVQNKHRIYLAKPDGTNVAVIAGTGTLGHINGSGTAAQFNRPNALAVIGNTILVADGLNRAIRQVRYSGIGDRFSAASYIVSDFSTADLPIWDLAVDHLGNIFFFCEDSSTGAGRIVIVPRDSTIGFTIAGSNVAGHANGRGDVATFTNIQSLAIGPDGVLYVGEGNESGRLRRVRRVGNDLTQPTSWQVDTLVRPCDADYDSSDGDEDSATAAGILGIHVAEDGTVWFSQMRCVRRMEFRAH